jgi:hypothetical protein
MTTYYSLQLYSAPFQVPLPQPQTTNRMLPHIKQQTAQSLRRTPHSATVSPAYRLPPRSFPKLFTSLFYAVSVGRSRYGGYL